MSVDREAVDIAVLQTEMKSLVNEVSKLRNDVDNLKQWRAWTIGSAFIVMMMWSLFAADIKEAITGP